MPDADLIAGFVDTCPAARSDDAAVLASALREHWSNATAAWPDLEWNPRDFAAFLGERVDSGAERIETLRSLRAVDLFLAGLAATGDAPALSRFDAEILAPLDKALSRAGADPSGADEVRQQLRTYLFSGDRKIVAYAGRAALSRWVGVAAVRTLHKMQRRGPELVTDDLIAGFAEPSDEPELEYFKRLYRTEFKQAFTGAIDGLAKRERNLLRHAILDGLTADQIGRIYHVSRSTAARQVANARTALVESTRARLRDKLDLSPSELQSVLRVIQSEVDLSVRRVLGGATKSS